MVIEASISGLFASLTICGIADFANAWARKGIGLNLGFLLLVGISEVANHFLNLLLLMQPFCKIIEHFQ